MDSLYDFSLRVLEPFKQSALVASLVCLLIAYSCYYYETRYTYWAKRGVNGVRPLPFWWLYSMLMKDQFAMERERSKKYGKVYGAFPYGSPSLMVADADVMRQITVKHCDTFTNQTCLEFLNKYQKLSLVWIRDNHWKRVRSTMSPTFTSSKIKSMFSFLDACADDLVSVFEEQLLLKANGERAASVNLRDCFSLFTMDGITTCCYGIKLQRQRGGLDLKTAATRNTLVRDVMKMFGFNKLHIFLILTIPNFLLQMFNFSLNPESDYEPLLKLIRGLVEIRRRSGTQKYEDLLQSLVDANVGDKLELNEMDSKENHHAGLTHESLLKDQAKMVEDASKQATQTDGNEGCSLKLSDTELLAEAGFLLAAGMDTTRTLLTSCTYALAFHPEIQERLYQELLKIVTFDDDDEKRQCFKFEYESLTSCNYLDAVISETLRYLAPISHTSREASCDYYIEKYDVRIPKGSSVFICLYALQNDPDYWVDPQKFDPERFMPDNKEKIVPGSYCPFGMGPRHCLGMRFGLTEAKLGLAKTLMRFRFEPALNTKFPPQFKSDVGLNHIKSPLARLVARPPRTPTPQPVHQ